MKTARISIKKAARKDIRDIAELELEFDEYLQELSRKYQKATRRKTSLKKCVKRLSKDWFKKGSPFQGLIARKGRQAQGYLLYHFGYDPEEMEGKVVYIVDFFVKKQARRTGIGTLLMEKIAEECKKNNGTDVYLKVWLTNKPAINFYRKQGATIEKKSPFMRWNKRKWKPTDLNL